MGDYLRSLDRYENIHLYPQVIHAVLDELIDMPVFWIFTAGMSTMNESSPSRRRAPFWLDNTKKNENEELVYPP